jgi:hypothetical protein
VGCRLKRALRRAFVVFGLLLLVPPSVRAAVTFANAVNFGTVTAFEISEASGIVASRQNPGVLWTHNDSGYPGNVFALSTNGALLARYFAPNVFFGNFEDIAIGPGPSPQHQYIYLGDIGDNFTNRAYIRVIRFPEPAVYAYQAANPRIDAVPGSQEIVMTYPDGSFDAEALMVDPITGDLFIATKQALDSRLYRATRAQMDAGGPIQLTFIRTMSFNGDELRSIGAGDISWDGRLIAMRRNGRAWVWNRSASQTVGDALAATGTQAPVATESNGEGIGFHATGLGYFTIAEGFQPPINFFRRTDSGVPRQPVVLVAPGEEWRYLDTGTNAGTSWRQPAFDDSQWASGPAQLGYGQGDEQTLISYGVDDFLKNTTTYFRKRFVRGSSATLSNLALRVCFNDGVAVYLNGAEIFRYNLATNAAFDQPATGSFSERQNYWFSVPLSPALVAVGTNTLAVELHRLERWQPDLSFDLQLSEGPVELPARFTGMPRLVAGSWRIDIVGPSGSAVIVEASSDLQTWSPAGVVTLVNGSGQFAETVSASDGRRFFRLQK